MRHPLLSLSLLCLTQPLISCSGTGMFNTSIRGEGDYTAVTRELPAFHAIRMNGGMQLDIRVGVEPRVVIHTDENLHTYISTEVEGGVLVIDFEESVSSHNQFRAEIDVPALQSLKVNGSSRITLSGLQEASFDLGVSGSAKGTIEGKVQRLSIDVAGSSNLDCAGLEAAEVTVDIAGSGKIRTFATRTLDVEVAGSGLVLYRGDPKISIDQAGSATVKAISDGE